jgi:ubiquinone/menaquinone biosynthesis C-methylase UbiE
MSCAKIWRQMTTPAQLAQQHWNNTPLFLSEQERYTYYPWLYSAAEFKEHTGHKVLEVGCGTGCDLLQFAKNGAIATGVDITERHLQLARERVGSLATVVKGDGRSLPFPDNTFDYVYSHGVIMCSDEPRRMVEEIFRVLKPRGRFNVHLYAKWSYFTFWKMLRHGKNWKIHIENSTDPVYIDLYTGFSCRELFAPCQIEITKHHCKPFEWLSPLFGWYLIVKGQTK